MSKININIIDPEYPELPWGKEIKDDFYESLYREWIQNDVTLKLEENENYLELKEENFKSEHDDKNFKKHYSDEVAHALSWGPRLVQNVHRNHNPFLYYAEEALREIQQKKLFDLQCQWRAEMIELKGISTTNDFEYWEMNIREAKFLSRITEGELKIYMDYLKSSEYRVNWKCLYWQNYTVIKDDYQNNGGRSLIPPWYHYHNYATQNSSLLQLPDIIGEKEKTYLQKFDEYRTLTLKENPLTHVPDNRPRLMTDGSAVAGFLREFKYDNNVLEYITGLEDEMDGSGAWRYYHDATEYLIDEREPMPIEENEDWKEAFLDVVYKYRNKRVANLLPDIYADYLTNKLEETLPNLHTHYQENLDKKEREIRKTIAEDYKKMIEIGKEQSFL